MEKWLKLNKRLSILDTGQTDSGPREKKTNTESKERQHKEDYIIFILIVYTYAV